MKSEIAIKSTESISSIFTARREFVQIIRLVVAGSGLTVEEADLLACLYGILKLGWDDLPHDADHYVAFKDLGPYLVHSASLLSRRIGKLAALKPALVETAEATDRTRLHFNALRVRITPEGIKLFKPVWDRYTFIADKLLEGISPDLLDAHLKVNLEIISRLNTRRWSEKDFNQTVVK